MKLCELTEQEFRNFLDNHPLKTFLQTPEIAKLRTQFGWKTYYVGLKKEDQIVAATMMLSGGNFLGKKIFYAPRGVLIDYQDEALLHCFFIELKKFIKNHQGYIFKMDPYYELVERDIDGNTITNGFNHNNTISYLHNIGFRETFSEQAKWMFVLDINGKSYEELKGSFRSSTKNILNKVLKSNITVRELGYNELDLFKKLTEETSERKHFEDKSLTYYQTMYQLFSPLNQIKFLIAEINVLEYIDNLKDELHNTEAKLNKLSNAKANDGKRKELNIIVDSTTRKLNNAEKIKNEEGNNLILSGGMFILYGDEVIYLYSGNYKKYLEFNAQYKIQYEMINYAIQNHYKRYNFYGITEFKDKTHKDYGVYDFKKGFNGKVIELIGGFELPIAFHYKIHQILSLLKNKGRK